MRSPVVALVLTIAVACSGYAFAADQSPQPLTRADCEKAGMKWDNRANVCGANAAAAAPAKEEVKKSQKKVVKKVKTGHGNKKYTYHKKAAKKERHPAHAAKKARHPGHAAKKERRGFFKWLRGNEKKS
jgi:hypothetical protein